MIESAQTRRVGDRAVLIEVDDLEDVHHLWRGLREKPPGGVEDVIAGARTVLLVMRPGAKPDIDVNDLRQLALETAKDNRIRRAVRIAASYDGPDLNDVAVATGLSTEEVVRRHSARHYTVAFLGFSPGFAYLTDGDPALWVPRLEWPRTSVPAGSVAVATDMTAIYPQSTPGGWRLIGRTNEIMFDPSRDSPSLLEPGDHVRFLPSRSMQPSPPQRPKNSDGGGEPDAYLKVLEAGPLTTVQDQGRSGWAHLGVPRAGAADATSAALANQLVGNPPEAALLEATLTGPRLLLGAGRRVAITGARADVTVEGLPARQDTALILEAGHEIAVGRFHTGLRSYISVEGGIDVEAVLGSRSTDTFSGLGRPPLRDGGILALGRPIARQPPPARPRPSARTPGPNDLILLDAWRGPRHDWIGQEGMAVLETAEFVVSSSTDRTGVRLDGPIVPTGRTGELPSEGVVAGAIQIPPGGQPIVLMRNHQPTGGYPVAAVVTENGIDLLAQARPGVRVRVRIR